MGGITGLKEWISSCKPELVEQLNLNLAELELELESYLPKMRHAAESKIATPKSELAKNNEGSAMSLFLAAFAVVSVILIAAKFLGNKDAKIDMNDLHKDDNKLINDSPDDL